MRIQPGRENLYPRHQLRGVKKKLKELGEQLDKELDELAGRLFPPSPEPELIPIPKHPPSPR